MFDARLFAESAHKGQMYGEDKEYMYHINAVVNVLKSVVHEPSDEIISAAFLHDVVEDTSISLETINIAFGANVASIVNLVTDPKGKNRKERKNLLYEQFKNAEDSSIKENAAIVKLSDRISNHVESLNSNNHPKMEMYLREYDDFIDNFHYKNTHELNLLRHSLDMSIIAIEMKLKE